MKQYRKKPIVISAGQWQPGDSETGVLGPNDLGAPTVYRENGRTKDFIGDIGWIPTLEGGSVVYPGDWIVIGVMGERYNVQPDIFQACYEEVESQ